MAVRLARRSPAPRESKAALTLDPGGGEAGAEFCRLGAKRVYNSSDNRAEDWRVSEQHNNDMRCSGSLNMRAVRMKSYPQR